MNQTEAANLANMTGWYDDMWGHCNTATIPQYTNNPYLRHDPSGPAQPWTPEQYAEVAGSTLGKTTSKDFKYRFVVEGDFVAAIGLLFFDDGMQWDWVQLFRLENGKLSETWLPAMGVLSPMAYAKPENSWHDDAIYDQDHSSLIPNKQVVKDWFDALASGGDITGQLAPQSRWHDIKDRDILLSPDQVQSRFETLMQGDSATGMRLHLIAQDDLVVATGVWNLGPDERRWNWVAAFQVVDDAIARVWWNAIGGTDASIAYSEGSEWTMDMMPDNCVRITP